MAEYQKAQEEDPIPAIGARIAKRLDELGLIARLPEYGILRIINDEIMAYWTLRYDEEEGKDEANQDRYPHFESGKGIDAAAYTLLREASQVIPNGFDVSAFREDGGKFFIAVVDEDNEAMFVSGHRITIENGKIISKHRDGTICNVGCRTCQDPKLYLVVEEGTDYYVQCLTCNAMSITCDNKWEAIGAWIIGKLEPINADGQY